MIRTFMRHAAAGVLLVACGGHAPPATAPQSLPLEWTDPRGFINRRVPVGGTLVHAIDYGGSGPAMVFVAGLGNSAHVFDDFAPRFTDRFHVIALTRRGYGESGRPGDGFDTATLVGDLRAALDALDIEQAVLVAHSVGGDELTGFGVRHPERVLGLVYLEAAYDRHGMTRRLMQRFLLQQLPPSAPRPRGSDRESATAFQRYLEGIYGVRWPLSEVLATRRFDARGRYAGEAARGSTGLKIMRGEEPMAWSRLRAPVLALYATHRSTERDYPWIRRMTIGRGVKQLEAWRASGAQDRFERGERERLRRELPTAQVVELRDASHYLFISNADEVEREMRAFLDREVERIGSAP